MKITRRNDKRPGGRFSISVGGKKVDRVEDALTFLEENMDSKYSQLVVDLILAEAKRRGWKPEPTDGP